ncbi:Mitochondrial nuclease [Venturia nashicola]|uniref:Mitochondrial nuclease n=1 Tax=Venturia nashicola TaxID=86259 RepID=A0A4Z1NPJ0_9PEZI|nr:Mitochondrial nuclease [Venturia nashicola]TLD20940.1 Mitochondrial nuclease [Venturia nashicola]
MATNAEATLDIETNKDQSQPSSVNISDKSPSVHVGIPQADEARDSIHSGSLRLNTQIPSIIPAVPGISIHHQLQYTQGSNSPYTGQNSPYSPDNPYRNVSQGSFFNALQDTYRNSSLDSSTAGWDSGSLTPTNEQHRVKSLTTWGSRQNLLVSQEDMSGPPTPTYSFEHSDSDFDEKDEEASPSETPRTGSTVSKEEVQTPVPIAGPPPGPPAPKWSKPHEWLFVATICSAQFVSLASLAQTISPLLIIGNDLKVESPGQLAWFTAAYSMTLGTFIIPAGRIGDMFGHKKIFIFGWVWLAIASFFAGFGYTWGPIALSIARGFQGIGPALLVPNAMALIGRTYGMGDKRAMVFSIFGACGPSGFFFGALIAAVFSEYVWWPWAFWATSIASLLFVFLAYCVIPEAMASPAAPPGQSIPKFDFLGCATGVTGLLLINFALNQAPLVGWNTPYVYALLIAGVVMAIAFVFIELKVAKSPLIPMRGLQAQALLALACIAAGWASHGIWLYYLFLFFMRIRGQASIIASLQLFPVVPLGIGFALSSNYLVKKWHVSRVMFLAMVFFLVGTLLLAWAPANQTYWALTFVSILIMPGGMNLSFPAGTVLLSNAMPREHQGKAASLVSTVVNYSIASGLGFAGSIERHVNSDGNHDLEGYRAAWLLGIGFSGLGVFISLIFIWMSRKTT